jgi:Co/Zn/Cd efflux system component
MSGCCAHEVKFDGASAAYRRVLWLVIALNAAMFLVEMAAGFSAMSQALKADALDFLGDTATYAMTLWAIGRGARVRAGAALVKGASLAAMAVAVFAMTAYRVVVTGLPDEATMGVVGALALAVNVTAALLLLKYRDGDANVRSVWLCSRNDAIGNVAVLLAAGAVALTATPWPDLIVAAAMAALFLSSALGIVRQARAELVAAAPAA